MIPRLLDRHSRATAALIAFGLFCASAASATAQYWQQRADYTIDVRLDTLTSRFVGSQRVAYTNNSPDTLTRFFFHLYFNAFQPGSMMDVRSRTIADPDRRVDDRISRLGPDEIGELHIRTMTQDGAAVEVAEEGTIAVVNLAKAIPPGATVDFRLAFEGQVPKQIRRSGRDNAEGIAYSMTQWYPKVVEYDRRGWHANPYVGREFYGVWGDFDVQVALPAGVVFAGTGYQREPEPGRFGDDREFRRDVRKARTTIHRRVAPMVHDFTWAADPDYFEFVLPDADGVRLEFVYQPDENTTDNWQALPPIMAEALRFANERYGRYPYEKYAFIQGGDGGMEYAMCTLITGERSLRSLVGVSVHELMHSWYQFVLATDESHYPWMDEGFTSFASAELMNHLTTQGLIPGEAQENPHLGSVEGYARFANAGRAEALSTHADHYTTNAAYGVGSYVKGELFLYQLRSVVGEEAFYRGLKRYYETWKFRHPDVWDFVRVMEHASGQELDWYAEYMVNTTHQVDYAVDTVRADEGSGSVIVLRRVGAFPFPTEVAVRLADGRVLRYLIPLRIQRGHAPLEGRRLVEDWPWTHPTYELQVREATPEQIESVLVNEGAPVSESDRANNVWPRLPEAEDDASGG